jgi:hypothetical protein
MKTRILHTKIWEDDFFSDLTPEQKLLFMYYITNPRIGLTGIYEVTPRFIAFETGLSMDTIKTANAKFIQAGKIYFTKSWVYVKNSSKLGGYKGEKLNVAVEKEIESIPEAIYEHFVTLSENSDTLSDNGDGVSVYSDTPINHKSEIINHKPKGVVKGEKSTLEYVTAEYIILVAEMYQVPESFVQSKFDDLTNWVQEKPTRARGRDLRITLRTWVKKDALERREKANGKIKYVGDAL